MIVTAPVVGPVLAFHARQRTRTRNAFAPIRLARMERKVDG
jgi:hypothetical protein